MAFKRGVIPDPSKEPPAGVSIKTSLKAANKVFIEVAHLIGRKLAGEDAILVARDLCAAIGMAGSDAPRLLELSLGHLAGEELSETSLYGLILWVMHNRRYLKAGEGIPVWDGRPPIWAAIRVVDGVPEVLRDIPVLRLMLRSYTGVIAGQYLEIRLSPRYIRWLLKEIGYPRYSFVHEAEIVGSMFWALIGIGTSGRPRILAVVVSSSMKSSNKTLFRERINKSCSQPIPCHRCQKTTAECGLACRST